MPHNSQWTLVLWCKRSLKNSDGITPTGASNARRVSKIFWTGREVCSSDALPPKICIHPLLCDSALVKEYYSFTSAPSGTTILVIIEVWWSQVWYSWHQLGWFYESLLITHTMQVAKWNAAVAESAPQADTGYLCALLLARLMGQYCFACCHLTSLGVVCRCRLSS